MTQYRIHHGPGLRYIHRILYGLFLATFSVGVVTAQMMPSTPAMDPVELQRRLQEDFIKCQSGQGETDAFGQALCETLGGVADLSRGQREAGVARLRAATDQLESAGDFLGRAAVHLISAETATQLGDTELSGSSFEAAIATIRQLRDSGVPIELDSLRFFGRFSGIPEDQITQLDAVMSLARPSFINQIEVQILLRRVQHQLADHPEAVESSLDTCQELSGQLMGLFDAQIFDFYGQLREKQGNREEAADFYRRAANAARVHRDEIYAERLERRLEALTPIGKKDGQSEPDHGEGDQHRSTPSSTPIEGDSVRPVASKPLKAEASSGNLPPESPCAADEDWPYGSTRSVLENERRRAAAYTDLRREAHLLALLSDEALTQGDKRKARALLADSYLLFAEVPDPWSQATLSLQSAVLSHQIGELEDAVEEFERAIALAGAVTSSVPTCDRPVVRLLFNFLSLVELSDFVPDDAPLALQSVSRLFLGRLLYELRRPGEASHHLRLVLKAASDLDSSIDASAHYLLGAAELRRSPPRPEVARRSFEKSLSAYGGEDCSRTTAAFPETCYEVLVALAELVAHQYGNRERALELSGLAMKSAEALGQPVQQLFVLAKRCSLFSRFESRGERLRTWDEGEKILAKLPLSSDRMTAHIHVATLAMCAGLNEKALAHVAKAEQLIGERSTPEYEELLRTLRAALHLGGGDTERLGGELAEIRPGEGSPRTQPAHEILKVFQAVDETSGKDTLERVKRMVESLPDEARFGRLKEAAESLESSSDPFELLRVGQELMASSPGSRGHMFGQMMEALEEMQQTGQSSKLLGPLRQLTSDCQLRGLPSTRKLGQVYSAWLLSQAPPESALRLAQERLDAAERCLRAARLDETFLRHAEQSRLDFEVLATLQAREGLYEQAFATAEQARAFALMRWLGRDRPALREVVDPKLYEELEQSKAHLQIIEERLGASDPAGAEGLRSDLQQARKKHDDLLLRLKLTAPGYLELAAMEVAGLEAIQRRLDRDSILISYFSMADQTLAWVIEQDRWRAITIPVGREALATDVRDLKTWLVWSRSARSHRETTPRGAELELGEIAARGRGLAEKLHGQLIDSLELGSVDKTLLLVAHDALQELPFAALKAESTGKYLSQSYALSLLPSASAVNLWRDGAPTGGEVLILGDPRSDVASLESLPHARTEAEQVALQLGVEPWTGSEARESLVRRDAESLSLLSIAAHGVQNAEDPRRSYLALAGDPAEPSHGQRQDGRLEMGEVFDEIRFKKDPLVVLSACESGLGQRAGGDEIQGFIRAFLFAGAGSVAATLWKIDDAASSELMQSFFGFLGAGEPAPEALRLAQQKMLNDPRFAAPYYWAGFSVTGNPATGL